MSIVQSSATRNSNFEKATFVKGCMQKCNLIFFSTHCEFGPTSSLQSGITTTALSKQQEEYKIEKKKEDLNKKGQCSQGRRKATRKRRWNTKTFAYCFIPQYKANKQGNTEVVLTMVSQGQLRGRWLACDVLKCACPYQQTAHRFYVAGGPQRTEWPRFGGICSGRVRQRV